ncbi:hypothetical protein LPTSP3_g24530 [Leptospira kobayashii]|uniref:Uncharacterized protein n=1 Tax=Leptospira kobayashii TaxID=1917830 RepID=A0ABN6KER7_9LEPT|nr:hypothetical protein [Leptospira kobayashii]BDA79523.1 hypothetical protein LPTSP3_g24530 [Leptospira kobayashii]
MLISDSSSFLEILVINTKAWFFTILTFGGFGILSLIQIIPKILTMGLFSRYHYSAEILAILTGITGIPLGVKSIFLGEKNRIYLKLFILMESISYTLLVLAAWLETHH